MIVENAYGGKVFVKPRSPRSVITDDRFARAMARELQLASLRTHGLLEKASPTLEHGLKPVFSERSNEPCPSDYKRNPPSSAAVTEFALNFFPVEITECWNIYGGTLDILTDKALNALVSRSFRLGSRHKIAGLKTRDKDNVAGLYSKRDDRIVVRGSIRQENQTRTLSALWQNVEDIAGHEFGHFMDYVAGWQSFSDDFFMVFLEDRNIMDSYSASNPTEFFATTAWIAHRYQDIAKRYIPATFEWFCGLDDALSNLAAARIRDKKEAESYREVVSESERLANR